MDIKDHIKGTSRIIFSKEGYLWYRTDTGLEFPIPPEDLKGATFEAEMRSMPLMRWIRKHIESINEGLEAQGMDNQFLAQSCGKLGADHRLDT